MKIKLHSPYDHFPNHVPEKGEKYIECFNDAYVRYPAPRNSIALLIEPRSIQPGVYEYMEKNYSKFRYIFTHDSKLLDLPNAKLIIWGRVYSWSDIEKDFSHPISMVASAKEVSPVRIQRKNLAFELKPKIDTYGTFDGGPFVDTQTIYGKYPFSVVIENYIDDYWLTEKICNCFANKCIPIYYGAKKITEYFYGTGIIQCSSIDEVRTTVDYLLVHAYDEYYLRYDAVEKNYKKVKEHENFENWFFKEYGDLLEDLAGEIK